MGESVGNRKRSLTTDSIERTTLENQDELLNHLGAVGCDVYLATEGAQNVSLVALENGP